MTGNSTDSDKRHPDKDPVADSKPIPPHTDHLNRTMVTVPGFTTPAVQQENLCPLPEKCSQEDINAFRSAGSLLKSLAVEARAWSRALPQEYRPAIVAILHGGLQVQVRSLAQVSFDGIRIEGLLGDNPCSLLAHQDTVQLICYAELKVQKPNKEFEHRPIGFIWADHDEEV